ncbi:hypothetical protein BST95_06845 [Halioglobus japonicus]|uniref:Uncharacterized protein n=1 Tax=Halioglobus japonicus TaxID=930805 RepID=A0AAP8MDT5_9GAMM|nr:hypothetical protein BST95_06845 [Halioglobus japonicus]PLW85990.1 hypothetical protein C0029_05910 [Halioglobus japonicus]
MAIVITTHGRVDTSLFDNLPFVSYEVAHIDPVHGLVSDEFLKAEDVRLAGATGDMGTGKYGFLHMFELKEGKYYLIGRRGRGYDSLVPAGPVYVYSYSSNAETDILMEVEIKGGAINYLGEILLTGEPLSNENVTIEDLWDRDRATAEKMNPSIAGLPVHRVTPAMIDTLPQDGVE